MSICVICFVLLLAVFRVSATTAFEVSFRNSYLPNYNAPFYNSDGILLSGEKYLAQLYIGLVNGNLHSVGPAVAFLTGSSAGLLRSVRFKVSFPGVVTNAVFQVRCWESRGGETFEDAVRSGFWSGTTPLLVSKVYDPDWCDIPCPPPTLNGLTYPGPPLVVDNPLSQTILSGEIVALATLASGSISMSYQWYEGQSGDTSRQVAGATNAVLTTLPLVANTRFWCRLTTAVGSTDSDAAELKVITRTEPFLVMHLLDQQPRLWIIGPTNRSLRLEYTGELSAPRWDLLTKLDLSVSPFPYSDLTAPKGTERFYRILPP